MAKISVIIPTFNSGKFLCNLFDSLLGQTIGFENIEVIFVDDASSDSYTLDLIESLVSKYSNCRAIFLKENSGFPGKPRNIGIDKSKSDYVIVADHDDSYEKGALEILYKTIIENNADFVIANYYNVYSNKKEKVKSPFTKNFNEISDISEDLRFFDIGPSIWTKLFNKKFLLKNNIKFIEGILGEDLHFYINSLINSSKTIFLNDSFIYNYNVRDSDTDKSTIHIRNKKYLGKMIEGYYKTWDLLKNTDNEKYFSNIFLIHLVYWLTSFIASDLNDEDKKELIIEINPILKKQLSYSGDFNEKIYSSLPKPILNDDYDEIIKNINKIKKSRKIKEKIKNILFFYR
ncbi:glycosyltransferase family 2 protein [Methanobrevibacter sp. DSM 116169]|uniref:glycosyltransferase family 2 protein n=1 Tax=Methanobrevibacter sp. DSM 116169 TaxID=3242727 RepID=UPI0038FCE02E